MSQTLFQPPSRPVPEGKITFEQFLEWLDEETHAEWVEGEVRVMSPVSDAHADLNDLLRAIVRLFVEEKGLGMVRSEPFLIRLGEGMPAYSPDLFFVSIPRLHLMRSNFFDGAPDLVVEIISPESRARDRGEKFENYEKAGVREYWLIDPERRRAEFYHLGEDGFYEPMPVDEQGVVRSVELPGLWLKVSWFWQKPLPNVMDVLREWGLV